MKAILFHLIIETYQGKNIALYMPFTPILWLHFYVSLYDLVLYFFKKTEQCSCRSHHFNLKQTILNEIGRKFNSSQEHACLLLLVLIPVAAVVLLLLLQIIGQPPNSDGLVKAPAVHHAPIADPAPGRLQAFDGALVTSDGAEPGELAAAVPAPQSDGLVSGAGAEHVAGDAEAQHGQVVRLDVAREAPPLAAEAVPRDDVAVRAGGVHPAVVGADHQGVPGDAVAGDKDALEEMRRLSLLPRLDAAVGGGGVDDAGVGGEGVDGVVVGADGLDAPEVGDAPDLDGLVPRAGVERAVVHGEAGDAVGVLDPEGGGSAQPPLHLSICSDFFSTRGGLHSLHYI
jgi:hypothetical protein